MDQVHLMCGVKTNVVTAVQISDRYANKSVLQTVSEHNRQDFVMQEVSATRLLIGGNLQTVIDHAAMRTFLQSNSDRLSVARTRSGVACTITFLSIKNGSWQQPTNGQTSSQLQHDQGSLAIA